jgi:hypothetical protein
MSWLVHSLEVDSVEDNSAVAEGQKEELLEEQNEKESVVLVELDQLVFSSSFASRKRFTEG